MEIPVRVDGLKSGSFDDIFNKNELAFLAQNNVFPNQHNKIEGSQVFDIYLDFIQNKREYIIFSLFATEKIKLQIIHFSDEVKSEYGYKYVDRWFEFYNESSGMDDKRFQSNETQFL